ncbi:hypothetical protein [Acinetobacter terrestris]|uniref:Uncharacterized protein n=1 Tax=Acinetobacter terrestris TaxID=2529843 RepID=A0AAW6URT5_9GAMM|nr:hypothetical protein [Acinetobacter terrestris]MDK1683385.1 hypothetical protein [Acinetobacter terrestris]
MSSEKSDLGCYEEKDNYEGFEGFKSFVLHFASYLNAHEAFEDG